MAGPWPESTPETLVDDADGARCPGQRAPVEGDADMVREVPQMRSTAPWRAHSTGQATVIAGDTLDVLRHFEDGQFDAVVTDPPYGIKYRPNRFESIANDDAPYVWWLADAHRVLRDGGALLCFCRWDVQEAFRVAIGWAGFTVRSQVIWDRDTHGTGDVRGAFAPRHDVVWFATKGRFAFPNGRPASIVKAMRVSGDELCHPNQKPVSLMRQLVRAVTRRGDVILDPFAGSGSTLVAAAHEGRFAVGIELDQHYVEVAVERCRAQEMQTNLLAELDRDHTAGHPVAPPTSTRREPSSSGGRNEGPVA